MSSSFGTRVRVTIFGESHGPGIGAVIDGLPAGEKINMTQLRELMSRRAPGQNLMTTQRKEADIPEFLSGIRDGVTCGTPLALLIRNRDTRSGDYSEMEALARPGHADYTGFIRYGGANDPRGGGHFSGRLTAPLTAAGGICLQILERRGIRIGAHLYSVGEVCDRPLDAVSPEGDLELLLEKDFPALDASSGERMKEAIEAARLDGDSIGGVVECCAAGFPAGLGDPMFGGVENRLAAALFGIPAVKGVEFGEGFAASRLRGSQNNDPFRMEQGTVRTVSNRHGGILGGISSGMPLLLRAAFKPTPSIALEQKTIDFRKRENADLVVRGRHDPCLTVRAVPVVEAVTAAVLLDILTGGDPQ